MDIIIIGILAIVGMGVLVGVSTWISRRNSNEPDIIVATVLLAAASTKAANRRV